MHERPKANFSCVLEHHSDVARGVWLVACDLWVRCATVCGVARGGTYTTDFCVADLWRRTRLKGHVRFMDVACWIISCTMTHVFMTRED